MNLYHLRYFMVLAEMQHFRKASEKLCITQPSLSHAISQLESELGVSLFDRQSRSSVLTKEGRQFLDYVQRSLSILDDGVSVMQKASMGEGIIKLGFLRTLGTSFVPEVVAAFLETQPDKSIQFEFFSGITSSLLDGLKQDKYDVVFCTKIDQEVDIEFTPVEKQDLVLIVPRNHPLANHHSIDLSETLPYPQVYFSKGSGLRSIIDKLFEKIDGKPTIAYEIEEDEVVAGLVSKGFGIAVVPYMEQLLRLNVKIIQISSPAWERNFHMATLKNKYLSPVVQEFREFISKNYPK